MNLEGKKALIIGFGKSGLSAAQYLLSKGASVTINDAKGKSELSEQVRALSVNEAENEKVVMEFGKLNPKLCTAHDLIILSPGVPTNIEGLTEARAAGIPIINDIELAYPELKKLNARIIAVTGTNGKTTTTTLIGEMLKNDGKKVFVGGNIGVPVLDVLKASENPEYIVLELSSFQLESIDQFTPDIAVYTNLEPDHLDRYPSGVDSYYAAKKRLLKNSTPETVLVTNFDNDKATQFAENFVGKVHYFTKRNPLTVSGAWAEKFKGAYMARPKMILKNDKEEIFDLMMCKLPGDHNRENIMAAAAAAHIAGCSRVGIQKTIETFKGVAHRLEFVRRKDGVAIYNDSKATNVASTMRALTSFQAPVILIAGGRDKDQDFAPLVDLVKKKVKNLILIGEAKEKINRVIGDFSETFLVGTFEEAVLLSYQKSRSGDIILLSPSCASYDMFKSYEERGDYFKKLVGQL